MNRTVDAYLQLLKEQVSGERAYSFAQAVAAHHRIQASPGYRGAALCCERILKNAGVSCAVVPHPANLNTHYFTQRLFKEWHCAEATLDLIYPHAQRLADFRADDMSIIQRSAPCDMDAVEIVYLPPGFTPDSCPPNVSGKLVFIENGFADITDWAIENGAVGMLTVSMPEIAPVRVNPSEDAQVGEKCANLSFQWYRPDLENKLFGFVLTPAQGRSLAKICVELAKKGDAPRVRAKVVASLYDGQIENVQAEIPGETEEEILITAHLCHPKSSVNDNASGVACAMETICAIQQLIDAGTLPKPKRRIRMLLMPEFTGTYAYLAQNENRLPYIRAGINLDMVGAYQNQMAGPMLVIGTPHAAHSFVEDLSAVVLDSLEKECALPTKDQYVALFHARIKPFMTGSDHYILSDPTIGIPSVAVTQWPDKGYHTSFDTLERLDPAMLKRVAAFTGAYVLSLASLTEENAAELLARTRERFLLQIARLAQSPDAQRFAPYCMALVSDTLDAYLAYFPDSASMQETINREQLYFRSFAALTFGFEPTVPRSCGEPAPVRLFKAPLSERSLLSELTADELAALTAIKQRHSACKGLMDSVIYAVNGRDSPAVIAEKVAYESKLACGDYVNELLAFLEKKGLVAGYSPAT